MILRTEPARLRLAPLVAALVAIGGIGVPACSSAQPLGASMPANWVPGDGRGVAALMQALAAARRPPSHSPDGAATTRIVTNCADDDGDGTLRATLAAAGTGDVIELGELQCSAITLAQGAIPIEADRVTVHGRGAQAIAIDGDGVDRVLVHYGGDALLLQGVTVRNGFNQLAGYKVAGGACIIGNGDIVLDHSVVSGCVSIGEGAYGGAILARNITLYTSTLSNNVTQGSLLKTLTAAYGAGLFAYRAKATLYDSTIIGNRAIIDPANKFGSYDTGAGVFTDNGGMAVRSSFSGNYTDGTGAAIASHAGFVLNNSTISGNIAGKAGGGLFVRPVYDVSIYNSTIAHNQARIGGGIYISGLAQPVSLQSTLVAENTSTSGGADIAALKAQTIGGANNLVGASSGVLLPNDTLHAAPLLLPLADNGGPTLTHALKAGSPAIDRGNNAGGLDTDQRGSGFARVQGKAPDIGAFERALGPVAVAEAAPVRSPWALLPLGVLLALAGARRFRHLR